MSKKQGVTVLRMVTIRKVALGVAMATAVFLLTYGAEDPKIFLITVTVIYVILVLSFVSRLPEGTANVTSPLATLPVLRHPGGRFGVRKWLLCTLVTAALLALYAYLLKDLIPVELILSVLFVALIPLLVYGVFNVVELVKSRKLTRLTAGPTNYRSLLRLLATPLIAMSVLSLLMVCVLMTSDDLKDTAKIIVTFVATFLMILIIYGIHRLFEFIQSRRCPPSLWPPRKRSV